MGQDPIVRYIEGCIREGHLQAGSKLPMPSIVAHELDRCVEDVVQVYKNLVANKMAYAIEGQKFYLMHDPKDLFLSNKIYFDQLRFNPMFLGAALEPVGRVAKAYESCEDLPSILALYYEEEKMFVSPSDFLFSSHLKEALDIILSLVGPQAVLVENPSHPALLTYFKTHDVGVFNRLKGIDFNLLELMFIQGSIKVFVIQGDQALLGGCGLSLEDKLQVIDLCHRHGVMILDVDFTSEKRLYSHQQSLFSLDKQGGVGLIKTFDHCISKDFQMVSLLLPEKMREAYRERQVRWYGGTSLVEQKILGRALASDAFKLYQASCQEMILKRYQAVMDTYGPYREKYGDLINLGQDKACVFVGLPTAYDVEVMVLAMAKKNIQITSVQALYFGKPSEEGFVLEFGYHEVAVLKKGIKIILDYLSDQKEASCL